MPFGRVADGSCGGVRCLSHGPLELPSTGRARPRPKRHRAGELGQVSLGEPVLVSVNLRPGDSVARGLSSGACFGSDSSTLGGVVAPVGPLDVRISSDSVALLEGPKPSPLPLHPGHGWLLSGHRRPRAYSDVWIGRVRPSGNPTSCSAVTPQARARQPSRPPPAFRRPSAVAWAVGPGRRSARRTGR
jgi:hypothetical protein